MSRRHPSDEDLTEIRAAIRKRCRDRSTRDLLLKALEQEGVRARLTKSGILVIGPNGVAPAHFSPSDRMAAMAFRAALRRAGVKV